MGRRNDCHDLAVLEVRCYITWIEHFSLNKDQKAVMQTVERPVCNKKQENSDILDIWIESEADIY